MRFAGINVPRAALRLAAALLLSQAAFASTAGARQTPAPRRPSGPAAGPVIKLPRGDGASLEQSNPDATRGRAERAAAERPRQWEYCAVTGFGWRQTGISTHVAFALVRFFPNTFEEVEGAGEPDALANAFARLGEDGWELTGIGNGVSLGNGNGSSSSAYFFKRPKRQRPPQEQQQ
jgi:hypothetical protein